MFGKKKKQAQLEAERAKQLALEQEQAEKQHPVEEPKPEEEKIFLESEIIEDDDTAQEGELEAVAYAEKQDKGEDLVAVPVDDGVEEKTEQQAETVEEVKCEETPVQEEIEQSEQVETPAPETVEDEKVEEMVDEDAQETEDAEESEDEQVEEEPAVEQGATDEQQEEVVYVVDGPEEDDEIVKPAKLVKLPNLVDYMLSLNMSKQMKMNVAMLLLAAYNKFKDIPEERKIIVKCMTKIMQALMQG